MSKGSLHPNHISDCIQLLQQLLTRWNHDLRSPLAIIANDLAYLTAKFPSEDLTASKKALTRLSTLLDDISLPHLDQTSSSPCSLQSLCERLPPQFSAPEDAPKITLRANLESLSNSLITIYNAVKFDSAKLAITEHATLLSAKVTCDPDRSQRNAIFITDRLLLNQGSTPHRIALSELTLLLSGVTLALENETLLITLLHETGTNTSC